MNIVFFGSFQHYSTKILTSLHKSPDINVVAVVTTPPRPAGRKKKITKTHTHTWAEKQQIPIFTPNTLSIKELQQLNERIQKSKIQNPKSNHIDFFIVAGYGKLLPPSWLKYPQFGSLNLHFSLLPKFRGANPAEWAILLGENETGVTLITMSPKFDTGKIIAKSQIIIDPADARETLYEKLYTLGAKDLPQMLEKYYSWVQKSQHDCQLSLAPKDQPEESPTPTAFRFSRNEGFIPWDMIQAAMRGKPFSPEGFGKHLTTAYQYCLGVRPLKKTDLPQFQAQFINQAVRALAGFPGVWTTIRVNQREILSSSASSKRLKILSTNIKNNKLILEKVQLEGQQASTFNQIKNQITSI